MLKHIALFYCSFIEKCKIDDNGRYRIGPSYFPENGYFGQHNTSYDVPFITFGLHSAKQAATVLGADKGEDKELVARMVAELLLQSVEDIIRIFPAWPKDQDAAFVGLRTYGGFLVNANQKGGFISGIKIESTIGGNVQIVNPWPDKKLEVKVLGSGKNIPVQKGEFFYSFRTKAGET